MSHKEFQHTNIWYLALTQLNAEADGNVLQVLDKLFDGWARVASSEGILI